MTYRIIVTANYYVGTLGAPSQAYATDDQHEILEFDTKEDAQEWVDGKEEGTYMLSHGETGRPEYEIVDSDDDRDACLDACAYIDIDAFCDREDCVLISDLAEIAEAEKIMLDDPAEDEWDYETDNIFALKIRRNETYIEVYVVTHLALKLNNDDLSNICWEKAAYFKIH